MTEWLSACFVVDDWWQTAFPQLLQYSIYASSW